MDVFSMVFTFIIDEMIFMKSFTLFTMKSKLCLDEIKACVFDEIKSVCKTDLFRQQTDLVKKRVLNFQYAFFMEVPPGFEPGNQGFADPCLTTWLWHRI